MRVLFLVPWPSEAASTRLRVEQYLPYLRAQGIDCDVRPFMSPALYRMVYEPGNLSSKAVLVLMSSLQRIRHFADAGKADVAFIHREAFPFGSTVIEHAIRMLGTPMVLDFDDAIYLPSSGAPNGILQRLKRPQKVHALIALSHAVVVANRHLQAYARRYNPRTVVMPTPVDTDVYRPRASAGDDGKIVIGWIGSGTTARYLDVLARPLERLLAKHPHVHVSIVGGRSQAVERLPRVSAMRWSLAEELALLHSFDIGIMPYPDDEWARGKAAFKALLYMSVGIPAVCSAIGMAEEIIEHRINGFLARSEAEWFEMLDELVVNHELRRQVGRVGREVVDSKFSLKHHAPQMYRVLTAVAGGYPVTGAAQLPAFRTFASEPEGIR